LTVDSVTVSTPVAAGMHRPCFRVVTRLAFLVAAAAVVVAAWVIADEIRTSRLQARYFTAWDQGVSFGMVRGPASNNRFPAHPGPYDLRLGYAQLPAFTARLRARGFAVTAQARQSPTMQEIADRGLFIPYAEKDQAGLQLFDEAGASLYSARYPQNVYGSFEEVPPPVVDTLTYIEDRQLLDATQPLRNPAMDWGRFTLAAGHQALRFVLPHHAMPGGSTLATQIQKFRHSPGGRTGTPPEKLRQMLSASLAAYREGKITLPARRAIVVHYLNTEPLAAQAGGGEIQGFGDGLAAWYGRDFDEVNPLLRAIGAATDEVGPRAAPAALARQALAFKQALSLLIAQRAPSYYLVQNNAALEQLTDSYLRALAQDGVIAPTLRDAALRQRLAVKHAAPAAPKRSFAASKALTLTNVELLDDLGLRNIYELERLDLSARSTIANTVEQAVSERLARVQTVAGAKQAGLYGFQMLRPGDDPSKLAFSFTLYERTTGANLLRVQTDSVNEPFDLNQGARLNLGSTAKLRTVILYLQLVAELHARYAQLDASALARVRPDRLDALTRWAVAYLRDASDRSLPAMLAAAVERQYSANPGEVFVTGGGTQTSRTSRPRRTRE
jgi:membrane peptidoglycan carboxypeptidase